MNKNIDYTALGKRIKNKRIEKGFTQEQLGELCELSAAHIGHIERGTRILSVDVLFPHFSGHLTQALTGLYLIRSKTNICLTKLTACLKTPTKPK